MSKNFGCASASVCVCVYTCVCVCFLWTRHSLCAVADEGESDESDAREAATSAEVLAVLSRLQELAQVGRTRARTQPDRHRRNRAPQFMLDLFHARIHSSTNQHNTQMQMGHIVRSFQDKGHPSGTFHYFQVTSVGKNERVIRAELRWYRRKQAPLLSTSNHHFYKVDVYEVLDSRVHPWRGTLITSRLLPAHTQGWEIFNITQTVCKWVNDGSSNNGLLLVTSPPSDLWVASQPEVQETSSGGSPAPQETSRRNTAAKWETSDRDEPAEWETSDRDAPAKWETSDGDAPVAQKTGDTSMHSTQGMSSADSAAYLVVFSDDGEKASVSDRLSPGQMLDGDQVSPSVSQRSERRRRSALRAPPAPCHRRSLYVDFQKMGWSSWIISPRGYNAYLCQGSCPFPLSEGLRATNHATVQSIARALRLGSEVQEPCCVPDSLTAISLLFFDEEDNVVLKQYQDMVAHSCGCH